MAWWTAPMVDNTATIYASRHDTDTTSGEPTRCNVADMVCVVSATWRRHVGMSVVLGKKNPRHDADITSQAWWPVTSYSRYGAPLPAIKHTTIN
jgi:hypothetical protein